MQENAHAANKKSRIGANREPVLPFWHFRFSRMGDGTSENNNGENDNGFYMFCIHALRCSQIED